MSMLSSFCHKIGVPHCPCKPGSEPGSTHLSRFEIKNSQQFHCTHSMSSPPMNQSVAAVVFGDGSTHSRLYPLTKRRSEAAIPIAGNYRLIDTVVSNCINSDVTKIYVLTQFNSTSLNSHLSRAYSGARLSNEGFVEVIAAYQSPDDSGWFQGTADAVRRCLWVLEEHPVLEFLLLPGHHLYKMDYQELIDTHRRSKADITISVTSRAKAEDPAYGVVRVNSENQVIEFLQDPEMDTNTSVNKMASRDSNNPKSFPSMGIYVINREVMIKLLTEHFPSADNLKGQVIPGAISLGMKVHTFQFGGYWEGMKSIAAYYNANMEAIQRTGKAYNFYNRQFPLYTLPRHLPPTLVTDAVITDSIIGDGCILSKCRIKGSVVGMRTRIGNDSSVEDSVIMGSDTYHHNGTGEEETLQSTPIGIGEGSHIRKSIVDKNARIGKNVQIINKDNVQEANMEAKGYIISEGIFVIIRNAVIPDGTIL